MARGSQAKEEVITRIKEAFKEDYIGIYDKKLYLWAREGNERVQIAVAISCPKNPIAETAVSSISSLDNSNKIDDLMTKLGFQ